MKTVVLEGDIPLKTVDSAAEVLGPPKDEVPAWRKWLTGALFAAWVAFAGALGQIIQDHSGEIVILLMAVVPAGLKTYAGLFLGSIVAAVGAYLRKVRKDGEAVEKRDALATLPPADIGKYY